jgi:hypothetical protein
VRFTRKLLLFARISQAIRPVARPDGSPQAKYLRGTSRAKRFEDGRTKE